MVVFFFEDEDDIIFFICIMGLLGGIDEVK